MAEPSQQQRIDLYEGLLAAISLYRLELEERKTAPIATHETAVAVASAEVAPVEVVQHVVKVKVPPVQKSASDRFLAKAGYLREETVSVVEERPVPSREEQDDSTMMLSENGDAQEALARAIAEADAQQKQAETAEANAQEEQALSVASTQPSEALKLPEAPATEENASAPKLETAPATLSSKPILRATNVLPRAAAPALRKPVIRAPSTVAQRGALPPRPLLSQARAQRALAPQGIPPTPSVAAPGESLGVFLRRFRLSDGQ